MMVSGVAIPLLVLTSLVPRGSQSVDQVTYATLPACPEAVARMLARAYVLSNPLEDEDSLFEFVRSNAVAFGRHGPVTICAQGLGSRLLAAGVDANDPRAYERAMQAGASEWAEDVAQNLNQESSQLLAMGLECLWLSYVLPEVANEDYSSYRTTGSPIRESIKQSLPLLEQTGVLPIQREIFRQAKAATETLLVALATTRD